MAKKINVFNRQAVYLGHDDSKVQLAVEKLTENGIDYRLKTEGMRNPVLSNQSFSRKTQTANAPLQQYIIYVHHDSFSRAKHVLSGIV